MYATTRFDTLSEVKASLNNWFNGLKMDGGLMEKAEKCVNDLDSGHSTCQQLHEW